MIGDKLLFLDNHYKKADAFIDRLVDIFNQKGKFVLSIGGISGTGKCIKNSYVLNQNGMNLINDQYLENNILNGNHQLEKPLYIYKQKVNKTIKVQTNLGYTLEGTEDHPIMVWNPICCELEFKKLKSLDLNDIVIIDRTTKYNNNLLPQITFKYIKKKHDTHSKSFDIPNTITPSLARFLGYFIANGNFLKTNVRISTYNQNIIDDINNILQEFNLKLSSYKDGDHQINSTQFKTFIYQLCDYSENFTARYKHVPNIILCSSLNIQKHFLQGLFDSDSCLDKAQTTLLYSTASKQLAEQIHLMLLLHGIISRKSLKRVKKYDWDYWNIAISSTNLDLYFQQIETLKYNFKTKKRNPNIDVIYGLSDYLVQQNKQFQLTLAHRKNKHLLQPKKNLTYISLNNIINLLKEIKHCPIVLLKKLLNIYDNHYYYDKIKSIQTINKQTDVYDYELKSHSFWSNGFISHNSEIASIVQEKLWNINRIRSKIIHIDDYYKVPPQNRDYVRKKTDIIGREEIDWKKIDKIINDFKNNKKKLHVQRIHKFLDDIEHCITPGNKIDVLIIEGTFALYANSDFKIYLDGNVSDTLNFRRKRGKENPDNEFRKLVLKKECNSVVQSKKNANIIIPFDIEES